MHHKSPVTKRHIRSLVKLTKQKPMNAETLNAFFFWLKPATYASTKYHHQEFAKCPQSTNVGFREFKWFHIKCVFVILKKRQNTHLYLMYKYNSILVCTRLQIKYKTKILFLCTFKGVSCKKKKASLILMYWCSDLSAIERNKPVD